MTTTLRQLPSVNELLQHPDIIGVISQYGHSLTAHAVRKAVDEERERIQGGFLPNLKGLIAKIKKNADNIIGRSLKPVINATGVILNTNLGRAPLGISAANDVMDILKGYSNLEFDLETGKRGKRTSHISELLRYLTGAEDVVVVNNNAAGILLALHTLAKKREVIVSRGELVEIGGSFRIPEVMSAAGVKMIEVGATNRTHLSDYENAITDKTALIIKVHQSNYSIHGFTKEVSIEGLAGLARSRGVPLLYDIGSGLLRRPDKIDMKNEPDVRGSLEAGADIVTFSCDKLLGGPQGGVVAGRANLIKRLSKAPLMRALRVGKLTIALLASSCRGYLDENTLTVSNPLFSMLNRSEGDLKNLAMELYKNLSLKGINCKVVESEGQCGGGSLPDLKLKSFAVALNFDGSKPDKEAERVYKKLLRADHPVIGILRKGELLFDVLTVFKEEIAQMAAAISKQFAD